MGNTLKDALLKAGLKPTPPKPKEVMPSISPSSAKNSQGFNPSNQRNIPLSNVRNTSTITKDTRDSRGTLPNSNVNNRFRDQYEAFDPPPPKIHEHQSHRTFCEVCNGTYPDVEYYQHRVPTIQVRWICLKCADLNCIPDETRTTAQSEVGRRGLFKRGYGATNRQLRPRN